MENFFRRERWDLLKGGRRGGMIRSLRKPQLLGGQEKLPPTRGERTQIIDLTISPPNPNGTGSVVSLYNELE